MSSRLAPSPSRPSAMALTSPPAQKPRPAPVTTTTPTSGSVARRGRASSRASSISRDMALSRVGAIEGEQGDAVLDGFEQILGHRGSSGSEVGECRDHRRPGRRAQGGRSRSARRATRTLPPEDQATGSRSSRGTMKAPDGRERLVVLRPPAAMRLPALRSGDRHARPPPLAATPVERHQDVLLVREMPQRDSRAARVGSSTRRTDTAPCPPPTE